MSEGEYISVNGWNRFQHYDPERRAVVWVKNYTKLLHDDAYLDLSPGARSLLHGVWLEYASAQCRVRLDTRSLQRRLNLRVTMQQLKALKEAGFIDFVASAELAEGYPREEKSREEEETPPSPSLKLLEVEPAGTEGLHDVYDCWRTERKKTNGRYATMSPARRQKIQSRLKEFSVDELKQAIKNVALDPWLERGQHDDLTVIFRSREQVEKFLEMHSNGNGAGADEPIYRRGEPGEQV